MSKAIELIRKSLLDENAFDDPTIIDTCYNKWLCLLASPNKVITFDYVKGEVDQTFTTSSVDAICSASLHPSGKHIIVAFKDRLQLSNVLADGIVPFFTIRGAETCVDCKFNRRGAIFAAIWGCGTTVAVYDFLNGLEICTIKCGGTPLYSLGWGPNCAVHAVCEEGSRLCRWDGLTGARLAEYSCAEGGRILSYALTDEGRTVIASSDNSIISLNRELKNGSTIQEAEEEYDLSGPVRVSKEGLVFVGMRRLDDERTTLIRICSTVGKEHFDQPIERNSKQWQISHDGRFFITNKAVYQIRDGRGYNQYITSSNLDLPTPEVDVDRPVGLLVSESHVEDIDALLEDWTSKVNEVEVMNELQLRSVQQAQSEEIESLKKSYEAKILELEKRRDQLSEDKRNLAQLNQSKMKDAMSAHLFEIHQLEEKYKSEILEEVAEHMRMDDDQKKEALRMEQEREALRQKHNKELTEFRSQANEKLSKQRETNRKLSEQRDLVERQAKERVSQLEDEIDDSISLLVNKFEKKISDERELSESLTLENGILHRKIESTRDTLDAYKDRVVTLLHKEEEQRTMLKQRKEEKERLDANRTEKDAELASKDDAVSKLISTNQQLLKSRDIAIDRLQEIQSKVHGGPLSEKMNQLCDELVSTTASLEEQHRSNAAMEEKIIKLNDSISTEKKKITKLESKIHYYDSTINNYLIKLEKCNEAIQKPAELKATFVSMQELANARQSSQHQKDDNLTPEQIKDNQLTFLYLEKVNELEELKSQEVELISKFNEEKAAQIAVNAALLKKVSGRSTATRRRSSIFRG